MSRPRRQGRRPRQRRQERSRGDGPAGRDRRPATRSSWEGVAPWYDSMVGGGGSIYHRELAIPAVLRLAELRSGDAVLDVGCGQGVLAPHVLESGASYVGVDASAEMVARARARRGRSIDVRHGDARALADAGIAAASADVGVFMLSIQDMDPLDEIVASTAAALRMEARVVMVMTHPCFRVPRGSGWGYDEGRKLSYRRVDRYLSEARVPMKEHAQVSGHASGVTIAFHRPLSSYVRELARHGFAVDALEELPDIAGAPRTRARNDDIPLFLALRARRGGGAGGTDVGRSEPRSH